MRRTETGEEKNHTQLGGMINQRTYWECGTGKTIYGHRRDGNTGHGEYRSDSTLPPLPNGASRTEHHPTGRGRGALEALKDTETGQDRRPPGRRPFWEPWRVRGLGRPWRIRGLGRPWRSRELGRPWRVRELGRPWRSRELGRPWWDRLRDRGPSPHLGLFGRSPTTPPKFPWGK